MNQNELIQKIDAICDKDTISITTLQRAFDIGFAAMRDLMSNAIELGLVEYRRYGVNCKILDPNGFKQYLAEHIPPVQW